MTERPRTLHLHIGLPKTATTWLQTRVFPELDHLRYVGTPRGGPLHSLEGGPGARLLHEAFRRSGVVWRGCGDAIFEHLVGEREAWRAERGDLLLSEEGIGRTGSRPELLAAHLREMSRTAADWGMKRLTVLCIIRRQDQWIASHYAQVSDRNRRAGQRDFEALVRDVADPAAVRYGFGMLLDFKALRDAIVAETGAENLLLLPYEALAEAPESFVRALLEHLGTPETRVAAIQGAVAGSQANVRSHGGKWRLRPRGPLDRWRERTIEVGPESAGRLLGAHAPGNRALAEDGLDLARYGYLGGDGRD